MRKPELRYKLARNFTLMGANEFLAALRLFYPISILYFSEITGSFTTSMGVFSVATITMAILEVPTGILSDKWGRRNLLIMGCLLEFLATLAYALGGTSFLFNGTIWLYIGGILFGMAGSLFSGNNYALLYETAQSLRQRHRLSHILGRNASMEQLGLALASAAGGGLLWFGTGFDTLVWLTLIPMGLAIVTAIMVMEPPRHSISESNAWNHMKEALHLLITNKQLRLLTLCSGWKTGWGLASHSLMPKFIEMVWPLWAVPFYRFGQNLVGFVSYWLAGKVTDKLTPLKTLVGASFLSDVISVISVSLANLFSPFLLFITQFNWAVGNTANDTLQQHQFSAEQRSTMGSLISLTISIINALAALALGLIADTFGVTTALICTAIITMPVALGYFKLYQTDKKTLQNNAQHAR
ncbi:MAG: MFS transporter [Alphaproteobacteria bacterium]|nr:MFS transporter [Alphaproteobacteria bacterium]